MKAEVTATPAPAHGACESIAQERLGIHVPDGYVGPLLLSGTGRTVWWTGRVAIGLRYEPPPRVEPQGQAATWVQQMLLATR
ncbi:hypothetical protein [Azohydromonas sediminis]|uniref:hypothetical protein n=1 Tax=Azohydromonas sediminis TaxID=2259674 RepID=UPI000E649E19|nr:hypothetical protein [Azohydromonas sediminis]